MNVGFIRSPQISASVLILAAVIGVVSANVPAADVVGRVVDFRFGVGIELSVEHWISDGLLAVFFFLAALELKHELVHGELDSPGKALVPVLAAIGGVLVPAIIYLLIVRDSPMSNGWPIPTATDIAFALGILALVGRHLPRSVRALLLALAVIDDLIAIVIIALFFTDELNVVALVAAVPAIALFGWISRFRGVWMAAPLVVIGVAAWAAVTVSGVHPTVAGVALGLVFASKNAESVRHALEPVSNLVILPLFAFVASRVAFPELGTTGLGIVFWAIVIALPVGKLIGITAGAFLAMRVGRQALPTADVLVVATLGGIGFTVSLLMNELAFEAFPEYASDGTLGVLAASVIAVIVGGTVASLRSRVYAKRG